jgi:hypothetical protein
MTHMRRHVARSTVHVLASGNLDNAASCDLYQSESGDSSR